MAQSRRGWCEADITWVQNAADHAWHDHEEHGHQLQVAAQDAPGFDVSQILSSQAALHYYL